MFFSLLIFRYLGFSCQISSFRVNFVRSCPHENAHIHEFIYDVQKFRKLFLVLSFFKNYFVIPMSMNLNLMYYVHQLLLINGWTSRTLCLVLPFYHKKGHICHTKKSSQSPIFNDCCIKWPNVIKCVILISLFCHRY